LRRFLQAYWLRPENAMWMALRSQALSRCTFQPPALDVCCGDGIFSFLHAGGEFAPEFDVFTAVGQLDRVTREHADMFDHVDDAYAPPIHRPPAWTIDTGIDLKSSLVRKAGALGFYGRLIEHNCEAPLPFADGAFRTVYCNAAYWVRDIDGFLAELARVTHPRGQLILQVKLKEMERFTLERYRPLLGGECLELIGRGRRACWPSLLSRAEWEQRFERAGLTIAAVTPVATALHAHIWDVGLRPIAPLLVRMANDLRPETRAEIKREWVELIEGLLWRLADPAIAEDARAAELQLAFGVREC
jgi:SAM-dependent methyltransferase